jgi:hypothetical protein
MGTMEFGGSQTGAEARARGEEYGLNRKGSDFLFKA